MARPRKYDYAEIAALYRYGIRAYDIAVYMGCSTAVVHYALRKERVAPKYQHRPPRDITWDNIRPLRHPVQGIVAEVAKAGIRLAEQQGDAVKAERLRAIWDGYKAERMPF